MKTKELIDAIKKLGYEIRVDDSQINIFVTDTCGTENLIVILSRVERFVIDTGWDAFVGLVEDSRYNLYTLAIEYAQTMVNEREGEKKYHYSLPGVDDVYSYVNVSNDGKFMIATKEKYRDIYKAEFTDSEVDKFPEDVKRLLSMCEKIEVTE